MIGLAPKQMMVWFRETADTYISVSGFFVSVPEMESFMRRNNLGKTIDGNRCHVIK